MTAPSSGRSARRRLAGTAVVLASLVWLSPVRAQPRALSVDDVLMMESFGDVALSPDGRWLAYERRGPFATATRFDRGQRAVWEITDVRLLDLQGGGPEPLLPPVSGQGIILGSWSPSGRRLLVYRLVGDALEAGVVDVGARTVAWTGLAPDMPLTGAGAGWRDDDRLLLSVRLDGRLPWLLRRDGAGQTARRRLWRAAVEGRAPSRTRIDTVDGVGATSAEAGGQRLVEFNAVDGSIRPLLEGRLLDFAVSPDGAAVAVVQSGPPVAVAEGPVRAYAMEFRSRLRILDLASGQIEAAPTADVAPHLLRWSAQSHAVLVWARRDGEPWSAGGLRAINRRGEVVVFRHDTLSATPPDVEFDALRGVEADWLDGTPVLKARVGQDRFDWYALSTAGAPRILTADLPAPVGPLAAVDGRDALVFAGGDLWRMSSEATTRVAVPDGPLTDSAFISGMQPLRLRLNAAPRRDWVLAKQPDGDILVVGPEGPRRRFDVGPLEGGSVIATASETVIAPLFRLHGAETLALNQGGGSREIDRVNAAFADLAYARPVAIPHTDRLGRATRSWLTLPSDGAAVKGLVVAVYPGAADSGRHVDPRVLLYGIRPAFLAAEGYAVLSPATPDDPLQPVTPNQLLESVDLAVDAALAAAPGVPRDRIAVLGHSFGGTAALSIASRTRRFRSYVAWSAGTDFAGKWGEFDPVSRAVPEEGLSLQRQMGWVETGQGQTGGPPWAEPAQYARLNPYADAFRIQDPVLLITADNDFVPMSQSERVFTVLHRRRIQARLLTYWGEGHFNWSPANIRDLYNELLAWLDETLAAPARVTPPRTAGIPTSGPRPRSSPPS